MTTSRPLILAGCLLASSAAAGCHAHNNQGVSNVDHGVTTTFHRFLTSPSTVELSFSNGSGHAVCLDPLSFEAASFSVKTDQGLMKNITPPSTPTPDCYVLAAGASVSRSIEAGDGFSRLEIQAGRMCYRYAFTPSPPGPTPWRAAGMICE